jgi:hypothetical protein
MKGKTYIQILAIVLMIVLIGPMGARAADKPGIELGEVVVVTAKVVAIDRTDRCVAVMGPEGNVLVLEVGKAAKNFDQIQVGDQVKLEYYEAVRLCWAEGKPPGTTVAVIARNCARGRNRPGEAIGSLMSRRSSGHRRRSAWWRRTAGELTFEGRYGSHSTS